MNKYTSSSSKRCILEVNLEHPKDSCELHNDYPLAPNKMEIKEKMLFKYQLLIADFHNIPIGNVKKLAPDFFDKENYVLHYEDLQLDGIKSKKYITNTQNRIEPKNMKTKMEKNCTN